MPSMALDFEGEDRFCRGEEKRADIMCVYTVYICRTEPDMDQSNPLNHTAPPSLCQSYYYTTIKEIVNW